MPFLRKANALPQQSTPPGSKTRLYIAENDLCYVRAPAFEISTVHEVNARFLERISFLLGGWYLGQAELSMAGGSAVDPRPLTAQPAPGTQHPRKNEIL